MIQATATPTAGQLYLVFDAPKDFAIQPMTVADISEGTRMVYFYNRLYIAEMMKIWLRERINVFDHVGDVGRSRDAQLLVDKFEKYGKASLRQVCLLVLGNLAAIEKLAPKAASKRYDRYAELVLPIVADCHEIQGEPVCS